MIIKFNFSQSIFQVNPNKHSKQNQGFCMGKRTTKSLEILCWISFISSWEKTMCKTTYKCKVETSD